MAIIVHIYIFFFTELRRAHYTRIVLPRILFPLCTHPSVSRSFRSSRVVRLRSSSLVRRNEFRSESEKLVSRIRKRERVKSADVRTSTKRSVKGTGRPYVERCMYEFHLCFRSLGISRHTFRQRDRRCRYLGDNVVSDILWSAWRGEATRRETSRAKGEACS